MIITVSGLPGSGKSTISKALAKKLRLKRFSLGIIFRKEAKKRRLKNKLELTQLAYKDPPINKILDKHLRKLIGKRKNFILDSRLAAYFYKNAKFKIYLDSPLKIRAQRIAGRDKISFKEALKQTKLRENLEIKQYKKQYGIDYRNKKLYNIILDTDNLTAKQALERLMNIIKRKKLTKII